MEGDVGIALLELADMGAEPEGGEARRVADDERPTDAAVPVLGGCLSDDSEGLAHVIGIPTPAGGEGDAAAEALEQREAEFPFQQAELMADGAACQPQLLGRLPHTAVAGEGIEGAQGLGRGNAQSGSSIGE